MLRFIIRRIRKRVRRPTAEHSRLREVSRAIVHERLEHFNRHYGFAYGKVFIKDQRSRWGSCSSKGNLNFNYRIALLPEDLRDYLVVHELCHLGQMNHSAAFWALVAETIPDYRELDRQLRRRPLR